MDAVRPAQCHGQACGVVLQVEAVAVAVLHSRQADIAGGGRCGGPRRFVATAEQQARAILADHFPACTTYTPQRDVLIPGVELLACLQMRKRNTPALRIDEDYFLGHCEQMQRHGHSPSPAKKACMRVVGQVGTLPMQGHGPVDHEVSLVDPIEHACAIGQLNRFRIGAHAYSLSFYLFVYFFALQNFSSRRSSCRISPCPCAE